MIIISQQQMEAFEASHASGFPHRFHQWWRQYVARGAQPEATEKLVFAHREEFDLVGVREEEDQFLFLYARALMPEMGDRDYLETMDTIMTHASLRARLNRLRAIAEEFGHRG